MNDLNDALGQLQDIHVPAPPSMWPLAPGWWLLIALLLLSAMMLYYWLRHSRRRATRKQAWAELERLRQTYAQDRDGHTFAMGVSILLRRAAMVQHGRPAVAALTGERWLQFLDRENSHKEFVNGVGACLVEAPYRRAQDIDVKALSALVHNWLRENL